jgi:hypothetical protein
MKEKFWSAAASYSIMKRKDKMCSPLDAFFVNAGIEIQGNHILNFLRYFIQDLFVL